LAIAHVVVTLDKFLQQRCLWRPSLTSYLVGCQ